MARADPLRAIIAKHRLSDNNRRLVVQAKRLERLRRKPLSRVGTDHGRPSELAQAGFGCVFHLDCELIKIMMLSWAFAQRSGWLGCAIIKDPYGV